MRRFFAFLIATMPILAYAQWDTGYGTTRYNNHTQRMENDNWWKDRFTVGLHHTADFYKNSAGVGLGLLFNVGRYTDLLNISFGAECIEYLAADPRPEESRNALSIVDAGTQLVVPVTVKLHLLRSGRETKFYVGCGAEVCFKMRDGGVLKHYYPNNMVLQEENKAIAIVPRIGWKSRNMDFGAYFKYYLDDKTPFNHSLNGKKDLGNDDMRIGYLFTWYF